MEGGQDQTLTEVILRGGKVEAQEKTRRIAITPAEDEIVTFLSANQNCATKEELRRFLEIVNTAILGEINGTDIASMVRTLYLGGTLQEKIAQSGYRVARKGGRMAFKPDTLGIRGASLGKDPKPSLLWAIAGRVCRAGEMAKMNEGFESILKKEYGLSVPEVPVPLPSGTPSENVERNKQLATFLSENQRCQAHKDSINQLFNLIDSNHLSGTDIFSLIRTLGLEEQIPLFSRNWRVANLQILAKTKGTDRQKKVKIRDSLMWSLLFKYCEQMEKIVQYMANVLSKKIVLKASKKMEE